MSGRPLPPPGWYPDPVVPGALRWYDGAAWTQHFAPPPLPPQPTWKGSRYGLPVVGPGSVASPGRRLGARLLDFLVLLPVFLVVLGVALAIAAPHFGAIFPRVERTSPQPLPTPGFVWLYLTIFGAALFTGVVLVVYETLMTVKWGRTLGKRWLGIRPVRTDGSALGWGRSFGRVALYWLSGFLSWIGLLDPLWCLWDADSQCLHDKVVDTIVVNDPLVPPLPRRDLRTVPTAFPGRGR